MIVLDIGPDRRTVALISLLWAPGRPETRGVVERSSTVFGGPPKQQLNTLNNHPKTHTATSGSPQPKQNRHNTRRRFFDGNGDVRISAPYVASNQQIPRTAHERTPVGELMDSGLLRIFVQHTGGLVAGPVAVYMPSQILAENRLKGQG